MTITYLGHSCFKIESKGFSIILDPYQDGKVPGYKPLRETADQVLCSHGHGDHCGTENVTLREGAESPFTVETIHTWHDDQQGALRGEDTIHILDDGQCRVAHLGDLGCEPTPEQREELKGLTALLIPVLHHRRRPGQRPGRRAGPRRGDPHALPWGGLRLRRDWPPGELHRPAQQRDRLPRLHAEGYP